MLPVVLAFFALFLFSIIFGAYCFQIGVAKGHADVIMGKGQVGETVRTYLLAIGAGEQAEHIANQIAEAHNVETIGWNADNIEH